MKDNKDLRLMLKHDTERWNYNFFQIRPCELFLMNPDIATIPTMVNAIAEVIKIDR